MFKQTSGRNIKSLQVKRTPCSLNCAVHGSNRTLIVGPPCFVTEKRNRNGRGDAAAVHPDGYVEIRDRLKDVIISGGQNVSSVEVEGALLRHPTVQEVAIVGMPDERWGEAPRAFGSRRKTSIR
ncbi:MAG: hypothetical protein DME60_08410 [Verrucomicrobia bacterium]|nr:MAG: hypothetical protein DME60_08410 [Verrucomicrobiota bacterium]